MECFLNPVGHSHHHDYVPLNGSSSSLFFSIIGKSGNVHHPELLCVNGENSYQTLVAIGAI